MSESAEVKRRKTPPYKMEPVNTDVGGAIADAFSELQSLRDEMRETADNMESGNLGQTEKCQRAIEAADTLDSYVDSEPDVPESASGLSVSYSVQVNARKDRSPSRQVRLGNAIAVLESCIGALDDHISRCEEGIKDAQDRLDGFEADAEEARMDANDYRASDPPDEEAADVSEGYAMDYDDGASGARNEIENLESEKDEIESLKSEIEDVVSGCDSVEFPGMYG